MSTNRVIGLFILTWILMGVIYLSNVRQIKAPAPDMPKGSIEKEINGIKYYIVPLRSE